MTELKVVLVGETEVGKTCIVKREVTGQFDDKSLSTLGASFTSKPMTVGDTNVILQIWDTAGQEKYRGMTPMYYHGVHVVIVVYSITNRSSFDELGRWINDIRNNAPEDAKIILVGNKTDLEIDRAVSQEEGKEKADYHGALFLEVSAKTGDGIGDIFTTAAKVFVDELMSVAVSPKQLSPVEAESSKKCC